MAGHEQHAQECICAARVLSLQLWEVHIVVEVTQLHPDQSLVMCTAASATANLDLFQCTIHMTTECPAIHSASMHSMQMPFLVFVRQHQISSTSLGLMRSV